MKPERILVPLDLAKCPLEVFQVVNGFAERPGVTVILLHVVQLNIPGPESRGYDQLYREAGWHLQRLAEHYANPIASTLTRVRIGKPAEEIVANAKEEDVDLLILPMHRTPFWKRLFAPLFPKIVVQVIREAPCGAFVMDVRTRLDCQRRWPYPVSAVGTAPELLAQAADGKGTPPPLPAASWIPPYQPNLARVSR